MEHLNQTSSTYITIHFIIFDIFELLLLVLSILVIFTIFALITTGGFLHIHLVRLIQICGSLFIVSIISRIGILFGVFFNLKNSDVDDLFLKYGSAILSKVGLFGYLQITRGIFGGAAVFIFIFMLYERTLATFMYKTYETWKNIFVIVIPFLISIIVAMILGYLLLSDLEISMLYLVIPCVLIGANAFSMLFGSYFYNLRKYKMSQKLHSYNLSHKFQLCENIRSIGLIWRACLIMSVEISFGVFMFVLSNFIENPTLKYCCIIIFNYVVATILFSILIALLMSHTWRDIFLKKLRLIKTFIRRNSRVEDVNIQQVKDFQGHQLVLPMNEEQELYFQQLQASWR